MDRQTDDTRLIEEEGEGLFDGVAEIDDADDDQDEFEVEAVQVKQEPEKPAVSGRRETPRKSSSLSQGRSRQKTKPEKQGKSKGRHAVTTSRGVVYVESYSDDDYEMRAGTRSRVARLLIALFIIAAVVVAGIMFVNYCNRIVSGDRVYNGITLNGKSVAGMTEKELEDYISKTYSAPVSGSTINVKAGDQQIAYPLNAIITLPDTKSLVKEIYNYGRSGNVISRAFTVIRLKDAGRDYSLNYSVNNTTINAITNHMNQTNRAKVDPTYTIEEEQVVFTYGANGFELRSEDIAAELSSYTDKLLKALTEGTASEGISGNVTLVPKVTEFRKLLKVNIVNDLPDKAEAARIERKSPTEVWIVPGKDGAEYDEALLDQILDKINSGVSGGAETEILPLKRDSSMLTKEFYEGVLFRDQLGQGTNLNTEEDKEKELFLENRGKNIKLAADKLNGLIIMPGEEVSFLDSIKAFASKNGFVQAYENYLGIDAISAGGGISQASTALYNAACVAGLEIVSRVKYTYAPLFGLMGFDAYTDIASKTDLKIKNNTALPVRINASYENDKVTVSVSGTVFTRNDFLDEENKPIDASLLPSWVMIQTERETKELSVQIARRNPFASLKFSDPTLPRGTDNIVQKGISGYTLNLYEIVRKGGQEEKRFIRVENYDSRPEHVMEGIMEPTQAPTEEPTQVPTEEPTQESTDNPPEATDVPQESTAKPGETPAEPQPTPAI